MGTQRLSCGLPFCLSHAQRPGDGRNHETRVHEWRQGNERYPVWEEVSGIVCHLNGQTSFADATSTGESEQPDLRLSE